MIPFPTFLRQAFLDEAERRSDELHIAAHLNSLAASVSDQWPQGLLDVFEDHFSRVKVVEAIRAIDSPMFPMDAKALLIDMAWRKYAKHG